MREDKKGLTFYEQARLEEVLRQLSVHGDVGDRFVGEDKPINQKETDNER